MSLRRIPRSTVAGWLTQLVAVAAVTSCATNPGPAKAGNAVTEAVDLVVAATTDVHGRLTGWDYYAGTPDPNRGLSRAATFVDSLRVANPDRVVLVDAGDMLQGNPLNFIAARIDTTHPNPAIAAMNAMRYDAAAVGNHDFGYGLGTLGRDQGRFLSAARRQRLSREWSACLSRVYHREAGRRADRHRWRDDTGGDGLGARQPSRPGGASRYRAGRFGRRLPRRERRAPTSSSSSCARTVGRFGLRHRRDRRGERERCARVARRVPASISSSSVTRIRELADTVINGTRLLQPKNWATSVGVAHRTGTNVRRLASRRTRATTVQTAGHAEQAAVGSAVARAHAATVAYVNRVIGTTRWPGARTPRVCATRRSSISSSRVERRAANADLASTAAFSLDASTDAGAITQARAAIAFSPYDNTLRAIRVSGRQLRGYLEFSARFYFRTLRVTGAISLVNERVPGYNYDIVAGADYVIDVSRPPGSRVVALSVDGKPVADADTFTMAINNYRQSGGGGYAMLRGAPIVYDRQQEIRELLIEEVARRKTLTPETYFRRNWSLAPAAAIDAAYLAMHANPAEHAGGPVRPIGPGVAAIPRRNPTPLPTSTGRTLRIIATNDFHGAFEPRPDSTGVRRGGAAYVATVIARARAECAASTSCASVLLDGGDMFQGTAPSNRTYGATVVDLYNTLGYSAAALGNHEWDWGRDSLRARMRQARYPVLGANVQFADGRDVDWIPDDTLLTVGTLKVGVIGVSTVETPRTTMAVNVSDLRFVDPAPVVNARARSLRARGADAVIVVAHAGAFCDARAATRLQRQIVDLARRITERVDAIVSGHTHSLVNTRVNGIRSSGARSTGARWA
jgi:2',3'-cyclic-nucleotide 2'-phosphodiesterase (5'-nucleotidase family)